MVARAPSRSNPRPHEWASIEDAAQHLGCSSRHVRRMIAAGEIAGYRVGKRMLRVDLNEIDDRMRRIPTAG